MIWSVERWMLAMHDGSPDGTLGSCIYETEAKAREVAYAIGYGVPVLVRITYDDAPTRIEVHGGENG